MLYKYNMSLDSFAGVNFDDPKTKEIFEYREKNMCDTWNSSNKALPLCDVDIVKDNNNSFMVSGSLKGDLMSLSNTNNLYIKYWAANSPNYNSNFSGSGLPFPNEEIAFENSHNVGTSNISKGNFSISMRYPNSYYINMGSTYIHPEVQIQVFDTNTKKSVSEIQHINLGEGIPFRTLTYPYQRDWSDGPLFYKSTSQNSNVRSQEQILLDSAYPSVNKMPKNFWGKTPPC
jgi:hypothetical protein